MQLTALPRSYRPIWLLLGWGMVLSIAVLSLIPLEVDLGHGRDKLAHFTAYGGMSFWFGMLFGGRVRQLGIAIAFAAMGAGIEFLQGMTDYRDFELADMVANAMGAGLGFVLVQTPLKSAIDWAERILPPLGRRP